MPVRKVHTTNNDFYSANKNYQLRWDLIPGYLRNDSGCPGNFSVQGADGTTADRTYLTPMGMRTADLACSWGSVTPEIEAQLPLADTLVADEAVRFLECYSGNTDSVLRLSSTHPLESSPRCCKRCGGGFGGKVSNFLLVAGFYKPHLPFVAPAAFFDLYQGAIAVPDGPDRVAPPGMPDAAWPVKKELLRYVDVVRCPGCNETINYVASHAPPRAGDGMLGVLPRSVMQDLYRARYASISYVDHQVGRLVDALDASTALKASTVVVLISDHGFHLGRKGIWAKPTVFAEATSVPFVLRVPGLPPAIDDRHAELVDLYATLVHAALGKIIPTCPREESSANRTVACTQGASLLSSPPLSSTSTRTHTGLLLRNDTAFSQRFCAWTGKPNRTRNVPYAPPAIGYSWTFLHNEAATLKYQRQGIVWEAGAEQCRYVICLMGYVVTSTIGGIDYRYAEYVNFNTPDFPGGPDFTAPYSKELYNLTADPHEMANVFDMSGNEVVADVMMTLLHARMGRPGYTTSTTSTTTITTTTTPAATPCCPCDNNTSPIYRYDEPLTGFLEGNTIGKVSVFTGQDTCAERCTQLPKCLSWQWSSSIGQASKCSLKRVNSTDAGFQNAKQWHKSYVVHNKITDTQCCRCKSTSVAPATPTAAITTARFKDAGRGAITHLLGVALMDVTLGDCQDACWEEDACLALSYFRFAKACRMSSKKITGAAGTLRNDQAFHNNMQAFEKILPAQGVEQFTLIGQGAVKDKVGAVSKGANAANLQACKDLCWEEFLCMSFSYYQPGKTCRLSPRRITGADSGNLKNATQVHMGSVAYEKYNEPTASTGPPMVTTSGMAATTTNASGVDAGCPTSAQSFFDLPVTGFILGNTAQGTGTAAPVGPGRADSLTACRLACLANKRCSAFHFKASHPKRCGLKTIPLPLATCGCVSTWPSWRKLYQVHIKLVHHARCAFVLPTTVKPATDAPITDVPATDASTTVLVAPATGTPTTVAPSTIGHATADAPTTTATVTETAPTTPCLPQFQKAADVGAWNGPTSGLLINRTHLLSVEQCSVRCLSIPGCTAFSITTNKHTCRFSKQGIGVGSAASWQNSHVPYTMVVPKTCATSTPTHTRVITTAATAPPTTTASTVAAATEATATAAPATGAPTIVAPATLAEWTSTVATGTDAPITIASGAEARSTIAPVTEAPPTAVPVTQAPATVASVTEAPTTTTTTTIATTTTTTHM